MAMTIADYQDCYSDFHKDAYGFRPRHDTSGWTLEQWERTWERLHLDADAANAAREEYERECIANFERRVGELIALGAADRSAAIRWLADGVGEEGATSCFCYEMGLPYDYFREPVAV